MLCLTHDERHSRRHWHDSPGQPHSWSVHCLCQTNDEAASNKCCCRKQSTMFNVQRSLLQFFVIAYTRVEQFGSLCQSHRTNKMDKHLTFMSK